MPIFEDIQSLDVGEVVVLLTIDLRDISGVPTDIYRFTPSTTDGRALVNFDGETYTPVPVEAEGFELNSEGALPRPVIRAFDAGGILSAALQSFDDLRGATVTRILTLETYLDDGATPDPGAMLKPPDIYLVNRVISRRGPFVELELAAVMDQEGRKLPGRQVLKDYCTHGYRVYDAALGKFRYDMVGPRTPVTCPWQGVGSDPDLDGPYFDENGKEVLDPAEDRCSKRLETGCKFRFGDQALPFRGFPGLRRTIN